VTTNADEGVGRPSIKTGTGGIGNNLMRQTPPRRITLD